MLMAGGVMGGVFSGNISDCILSLERLANYHASVLLPGHGKVSEEVSHDIRLALERSRALLADTRLLFGAWIELIILTRL